MSDTQLSFPINRLFPIKEDLEACKQDPSLKPFILIANCHNFTAIKFSLDQLKECNTPAKSKFNLTLLSIATMTQKHDVMKYLLFERNVEPNPKDQSGLTPLHYACALNDTLSINMLQEAMKVKEASFDVFKIFPGWKTAFAEPPTDKESEFFKKTGAHYCDEVVANPETFIFRLCDRLSTLNSDAELKTLNEEFCRQFETREKENEILRLDEEKGAGLGVFAKKDIPAKRIIGFYGGKLTYNQTLENYDFFYNDINAEKRRNLIAMANDGFPNLKEKFNALYIPK